MTQQSSVIFSSISIFYHHINRRFFSLCGGHPRKVWTAKYSDKTRGLCDKDILKLVLLVPFFAPFLGKQKRREIKEESISVQYVLYIIELTFFFLDEKEPKNVYVYFSKAFANALHFKPKICFLPQIRVAAHIFGNLTHD